MSATGGVVAMVPEGLILLTQRRLRRRRRAPGPAPHAGAGAARHRDPGPGRRRLPRQDRHHHRGRRWTWPDVDRLGATATTIDDALPPRWPGPTRTPTPPSWPSRTTCRPARRLDGDRHGPVLVGPQVERVDLRRPRRLGVRRARDAARRRRLDEHRRQVDEPGRRRPAGAAAGAERRGRSTASDLPDDLAPAALVMIEDRIRPDAAETLAYFDDQGVTLKVISGDNPTTVGAVAARAGLPDADDLIDARDAARRRRPEALRRRRRGHHRLRPGHPAPEAGHGRPRCSRAATWWP